MKFFFIKFILIFSLFHLVIPNKSTESQLFLSKPPSTRAQKPEKQIVNPSNCPCFKHSQKCPPCNPYSFSKNEINCPCAPKINCPPCILAKTQKFLHEQAGKEVAITPLKKTIMLILIS